MKKTLSLVIALAMIMSVLPAFTVGAANPAKGTSVTFGDDVYKIAGETNLIANPSFEDDLGGWTVGNMQANIIAMDDETVEGVTWERVESSVYATDGDYAIRAIAGNGLPSSKNSLKSYLPLALDTANEAVAPGAGKLYYLSFDVYNDTTGAKNTQLKVALSSDTGVGATATVANTAMVQYGCTNASYAATPCAFNSRLYFRQSYISGDIGTVEVSEYEGQATLSDTVSLKPGKNHLEYILTTDDASKYLFIWGYTLGNTTYFDNFYMVEVEADAEKAVFDAAVASLDVESYFAPYIVTRDEDGVKGIDAATTSIALPSEIGEEGKEASVSWMSSDSAIFDGANYAAPTYDASVTVGAIVSYGSYTSDAIEYTFTALGVDGINPEEVPTYTDMAGKVYIKANNVNLLENGDFANGMEYWTNALDGGAAGGEWVVEDNSAASFDGVSAVAYQSGAQAHGSNNSGTLRRYVALDPGTYYLSYYVNNVSSSISENTWSCAVVVDLPYDGEGGKTPVFGTTNGIVFYDNDIYGGLNSWSNESANSYIGGKHTPANPVYNPGMNHVEYVITVPDGSDSAVPQPYGLMLSYGAWSSNANLKFSNFELFELTGVNELSDAVAALTLSDGELTESLDLPTTYGEQTTYTWESSNETVLANDGTFTPAEYDTELTLTATIKTGAIAQRVTYNFTAKGILSRAYEAFDLEGYTSAMEFDPAIALPTGVDGFDEVELGWTSSDKDIYDAETATFTAPEKSAFLVLTATLSYGGESKEKSYAYFVYGEDGEAVRSLNEGLVAYYPFDDGAASDFSGNGYDATVVNNNGAMAFEHGWAIFPGVTDGGLGAAIQIPDEIRQNLGSSFAISMWVKQDESYAYNNSSSVFFDFGSPDDLYTRFFFQYRGNAVTLQNRGTPRVISEATLADGKDFKDQWNLLTINFDLENSDVDVYVDGEEVAWTYNTAGGSWSTENALSTNAALNAFTNHTNFLGRNQWHVDSGQMLGNADLKGAMDDVRFYNRTLTTDEIFTLYEAATPTPAAKVTIEYRDLKGNLLKSDSADAHKFAPYTYSDAESTVEAAGVNYTYQESLSTLTIDEVKGDGSDVITLVYAPEDNVSKAHEALTIEEYVEGMAVNYDLALTTSFGEYADVTVEWASSDEDVIANNGAFTAPAYSKYVKLTATVSSNLSDTVLTKEFTVYAVEEADEDLILHYNFNDVNGATVPDATGHGYDGTLYNASLADANGEGVLELNGNASYVHIPSGIAPQMRSYTVAAYINTASFANNSMAVSLATTNSPNQGEGEYWLMAPYTSSSRARTAITLAGYGNETSNNIAPTLKTGVWEHYAATFDANTGKYSYYIDGKLVQTIDCAISPASFGGDDIANYIGRSPFAADPYYNAKFEEFRIYSRALSEDEIADLYVNDNPTDRYVVTIERVDAEGYAIGEIEDVVIISASGSYTYEVTDSDRALTIEGATYVFNADSEKNVLSISALGKDSANNIVLAYDRKAVDHVEEFSFKTLPGKLVDLPEEATVYFTDETSEVFPVEWIDVIEADMLEEGETIATKGIIHELDQSLGAIIEVLTIDYDNFVDALGEYSTMTGRAPKLPETVTVPFIDSDENAYEYDLAIEWNIADGAFDTERTFELTGEVEYTGGAEVSATVTVIPVKFETIGATDNTFTASATTSVIDVKANNLQVSGMGGTYAAGQTRYTFVRFDAADYAETALDDIVNVTFSLYEFYKGNKGNPVFNIYGIAERGEGAVYDESTGYYSDQWNPATLIWTGQDAFIEGAELIDTVTYLDEYGQPDSDYGNIDPALSLEFDVTGFVKAQIASGKTTFSFYITCDTCANKFAEIGNATYAGPQLTFALKAVQVAYTVNYLENGEIVNTEILYGNVGEEVGGFSVDDVYSTVFTDVCIKKYGEVPTIVLSENEEENVINVEATVDKGAYSNTQNIMFNSAAGVVIYNTRVVSFKDEDINARLFIAQYDADGNLIGVKSDSRVIASGDENAVTFSSNGAASITRGAASIKLIIFDMDTLEPIGTPVIR